MGLREKVTLALLAISTQIVSNNCMPRGHSNSPSKSCTKNAKSPELFRFPDVEYPSDFEAGEYCRFLSDYPVQFQTKICTNNSSPQALTYERQAKLKRKYDMANKIKTKPEIATSSTECDCLPHPYCFRKSSFFPDVEYPLSARDTWIPTYWSRLQDATINGSVQKNIQTLSTVMTQNSNVDTTYNNSPLSSLIKALNIKKESASTTPVSDNNNLPIQNEVDTFTVKNVSDTVGVMSSDVPTEPSIPRKDIVSTIKNTTQIDINYKSINAAKNMLCDIVTTTNNTENNGPLYISGNSNLDDIIPTITSGTNNVCSLERSGSNKELLEHILGTTTENNGRDLKFPVEAIQNNTVSTGTQVSNSGAPEALSVTNKDGIDHEEVKNIDTPNKDNKGFLDSVLPISTTASNDSIKPDIFISKCDSFTDNMTTITNAKSNDDALRLPVFQEDKPLFYNTVPTTINAAKRQNQESPISENEPLQDIAPSKSIIEKIQSDIIVSTTTIPINSNIKPETSISKNDLGSDIVTSTTQTGDDVLEQPVPNDNKTLLSNVVSATTIPIHSDIKPETSMSKGDGHVDIIRSTKNTNTSIPKLLPRLFQKAPLDNTINSDPTLETCFNKTDQLGSPLTEMANTKNNKVIPELPVFVENTSPIENMVATDINSTNEDIESKTGNSTNELLGDIVPTMTNTKSGDLTPPLDILKTPMAHNTTVFSPAQNAPRKDKSPDGNITSTTTKPSQIIVDSEEFSTEENPLPSTDNTLVASSTTNSVLTTPSPLSFNCPNSDIQPINELKNFTNSWVMRQNTWPMVPEYSDDWIIYVDDENDLPTRGNYCEDEGNRCYNSALSGLNTEADNYGYIVFPTVPDYCDDSWLLDDTGKTTQDLATNGFEPVHFLVEINTSEGSIPEANDTVGLIVYTDESNSTLKYEYVDDESVSCTEMPYELVVYPEYVNYTWSAFANDSYVLCNPIRDYSDDICLLFIDTNGTIPLGDII